MKKAIGGKIGFNVINSKNDSFPVTLDDSVPVVLDDSVPVTLDDSVPVTLDDSSYQIAASTANKILNNFSPERAELAFAVLGKLSNLKPLSQSDREILKEIGQLPDQ